MGRWGGVDLAARLDALWNRGLPDHVHITPRMKWPLVLLAVLLLVQLIMPSMVWMTVGVTLLGLHALALAWVRIQAKSLRIVRTRQGTVVVAGDTFGEEFRLINDSWLPVIWAEFDDDSQLPGYEASRVVGCSGQASFRWRSQAVCERRGVYRLGPHRLISADPLGIFDVTVDPHQGQKSEMALVYPRVVFLPPVELPRGNTSGRDRRRRPLMGNLRSASVREYFPGDSLRHVHWPSSAHQGRLMVTELDIEPSGDLWIVLDLDRAAHRGRGESGTLEYSIILAASLAAELLSGGERRSVGLLAAGGDGATLLLPPQPGQAQLWQILAALAPVQPGEVSLGELLHNSREVFGRGRTVVVITPGGGESAVTELVYLQGVGLASSVLLVAAGKDAEAGGEETEGMEAGVEAVRGVLARMDVPVQVLHAGAEMRPALTFRRTRTVVRTTPTGGVVTYEVEEEVG